MPKLRRPEQAMTDHLSARLPAGTLERIDRAGNGDRQQGARAVIAAGLETTMSDTDNLTAAAGPAPFGVRLDAATLARLDAYAARIDRKRGGAAARVIVAGLDALEGLPVRAPERSAKDTANAAALDVDALADAVADRVVPAMADAVAYGVALRSEKLPVPVEEFSLFDVR